MLSHEYLAPPIDLPRPALYLISTYHEVRRCPAAIAAYVFDESRGKSWHTSVSIMLGGCMSQ